MKHGDDAAGCGGLDEIHCVREAARALSPHDRARETKHRSGHELIGVANALKHALDRRDELVPETFALLLVPDRCGKKIDLRRRIDREGPHAFCARTFAAAARA